jgi:hypothetical protein
MIKNTLANQENDWCAAVFTEHWLAVNLSKMLTAHGGNINSKDFLSMEVN